MTFRLSMKWDDIQESTLSISPHDDTTPQPPPQNRVTDQQVLRAFCEPITYSYAKGKDHVRAFNAFNVSGNFPHNRRLRITWDFHGKVLLANYYQLARWWPYVCRFHGDNTPEHGALCPLSKPKIVVRRLDLTSELGLDPFREHVIAAIDLPYPYLVRALLAPPNPRLVARGKQIVPDGVEVILASQPTPNFSPGMLLLL